MPANADGHARIAAACITRPQLAVLRAICDADDAANVTDIASAAGVPCTDATAAIERLIVLRLAAHQPAGPRATEAGMIVREQLAPALATA